MRFQVTLILLLLAFMLTKVKSIQVNSPKHKYCAECEEGIWEEIPCPQVSSTTLAPPIPTTIRPTPLPSTIHVPTTLATTPLPSVSFPPTIRTTTLFPPTLAPTRPLPPTPTLGPLRSTPNPIESSASFKKCYCECKSGCKEFCRKVVVYPDTKKQITQLSKTTHPLNEGQLEVKHLLERTWIPAPAVYNPNNQPILYEQSQQQIQQTQNSLRNAPQYGTIQQMANYQRQHDVNSYGFSIEELTKLLNSDQSYTNMIPEISQPPIVYQNVYASPLNAANQPKNSNFYTPPQNIPFLKAKTSNSGFGSAKSIARSKIDFKESVVKSYSGAHQDLESQIGIKPIIAPVQPLLAPCASQYTDNFPSNNNLPKQEPSLDNNLRNFLYSSPPKERGYERSISY